MKQEQAREIADAAMERWDGTGEIEHVIADALHAAYEAERVQHQNLLDDTGLTLGHIKSVNESLRLASIKETARGIWEGYFSEGEIPLSQWYGFDGGADQLAADCDAAIRFAEALESAFERRYGGKP